MFFNKQRKTPKNIVFDKNVCQMFVKCLSKTLPLQKIFKNLMYGK